MKINLAAALDEGKFGRLQATVLALCFLLIIADGYDLVIMGVALPAIITEMKMDPSVGGLIASCALIGMMFGAMLFGSLADRIGRVRTVIMCIIVFSLFTAATGLAKGPIAFASLRFVAGLGLGGVIPCIIAAVSEFSPKQGNVKILT